ncbi:small ribosomal subunit protein mS26 isoform X2 [Panulirus ornatus]|uniref:small ribosomal subunit protein mS26 isoform X2 n=1 Tax=Panulirus ornatus TaxID=150431 RepID=UPI003A8C4D08
MRDRIIMPSTMEDKRDRRNLITAFKHFNLPVDTDSEQSFKRYSTRVTEGHDKKLGKKLYQRFKRLIENRKFRRWRKPRWVPTAKSKIFRIPERKVFPKEELIELKRLHDRYNTMMRAVRRHLTEEIQRTSDTSELAMKKAADEELEHQRLMEYNQQENLRVASQREERIRKEFEADLARVEATKEKQAKITLQAQDEAIRLIAETQELVKTFIKREDLEDAIETALANPADYNFAIDEEGYIFRGRNTKPEDVAVEDREKLASVELY